MRQQSPQGRLAAGPRGALAVSTQARPWPRQTPSLHGPLLRKGRFNVKQTSKENGKQARCASQGMWAPDPFACEQPDELEELSVDASSAFDAKDVGAQKSSGTNLLGSLEPRSSSPSSSRIMLLASFGVQRLQDTLAFRPVSSASLSARDKGCGRTDWFSWLYVGVHFFFQKIGAVLFVLRLGGWNRMTLHTRARFLMKKIKIKMMKHVERC